MSKVIDISGKLSMQKPSIKLGEKTYEINDSVEAVMQIEEIAGEGTTQGILTALDISLGADIAAELNTKKMSVGDLKILFTAILAGIQDVTYEEAAARFQKIENAM